MSLKKLSNITPAELKSKGVVSLADKPNAAASYGVGGLSPTALKLWFDQLSKLLADKINAIQDALSGDNAAEYIKLILTGLASTNETGEFQKRKLCGVFAGIRIRRSGKFEFVAGNHQCFCVGYKHGKRDGGGRKRRGGNRREQPNHRNGC